MTSSLEKMRTKRKTTSRPQKWRRMTSRGSTTVYSYFTASCYWVARSCKVVVNFVVNPAVVTYHHGKLQESTFVDKVLPRQTRQQSGSDQRSLRWWMAYFTTKRKKETR